ncbi:hypothetical protein BpHYR1_029430 [Brachionus plicatilis]|uniref:Uncharacterized protein n=1 Tax=Brachionus plicatilis TaxID=10195 RepID=A0A3M7Q0D7_BRAPC|nr:hypothetical protein BpHYR1_029430 [Brachionus plicatilis]
MISTHFQASVDSNFVNCLLNFNKTTIASYVLVYMIFSVMQSISNIDTRKPFGKIWKKLFFVANNRIQLFYSKLYSILLKTQKQFELNSFYVSTSSQMH